VDLREKVIRDCVSQATAFQREATRSDYLYMTQDTDIMKLLKVLSEFGKFSRYYNLGEQKGSGCDVRHFA